MCVSAGAGFGMAGLVVAVPLSYLSFSYAHISVLCFFAATMTLYVAYVILEGECEAHSSIAAYVRNHL